MLIPLRSERERPRILEYLPADPEKLQHAVARMICFQLNGRRHAADHAW
jgi:hypothetical protein